MPIIERDVINRSQDEGGNTTIDFPLARLGWMETTADVKSAPGGNDYIPIVDGDDQEKIKKVPAHTLSAGGGAALYSATSGYAVGDYCGHDGKLYRCTVAVPNSGEAWNPAHWKEVTLAGELKAVQSQAAANAQGLTSHTAAANPHKVTAAQIGAVPTTRKINGKPLSGDISLSFANLSGAVFAAGSKAPANTGLLWIDTNATTGGLKYFNGTAWVHVPVAYT